MEQIQSQNQNALKTNLPIKADIQSNTGNSIDKLCSELDFEYAELYNIHEKFYVRISKYAMKHPGRYKRRMYGRFKLPEDRNYGRKSIGFYEWNQPSWQLILWEDKNGNKHRPSEE